MSTSSFISEKDFNLGKSCVTSEVEASDDFMSFSFLFGVFLPDAAFEFALEPLVLLFLDADFEFGGSGLENGNNELLGDSDASFSMSSASSTPNITCMRSKNVNCLGSLGSLLKTVRTNCLRAILAGFAITASLTLPITLVVRKNSLCGTVNGFKVSIKSSSKPNFCDLTMHFAFANFDFLNCLYANTGTSKTTYRGVKKTLYLNPWPRPPNKVSF